MIYSPSETKAWLESPIGRYLHYVEGWSPKVLGKKELSGVLGSAFSEGIQVWYGGMEDPQVVAQHILKTELERLFERGHTVNPKEELFYNNLPTHLEKLLTKAVEQSPISTDWLAEGAEVKYSNERCRLDLLVNTPEGITFVDYKTKSTLDGFYKDKQLGQWGCDWQFMHYMWTLMQHHVTAPQYHVALITYGDAKKPSLHTYPVDTELVGMWEVAAKAAWATMEAEEVGHMPPLWRFTKYDQYGLDPWYDAVVNAKLEPHLMERYYIQHGGRRRE